MLLACARLWGGGPKCPPSCPAPSSPLSLWGKQRVAAAALVRAGPDLWPCLTLVSTEPCDKTRPQERGFNKLYRFLELRVGDFPEDRLCLAGGLCTVGTWLPLSSSAVSTAATLYLSLTTWKYYPPPDPVPLQLGCRFSNIPSRGGRAGPGGPSNGLWDAWLGWTRPGLACPATTPSLSSLLLTGATGNQAGHRFASVSLAVKWAQISHPFHLPTRWATLGRLTVFVSVLPVWALEIQRRGEKNNPILVGARGSVRNLGYLNVIILLWL